MRAVARAPQCRPCHSSHYSHHRRSTSGIVTATVPHSEPFRDVLQRLGVGGVTGGGRAWENAFYKVEKSFLASEGGGSVEEKAGGAAIGSQEGVKGGKDTTGKDGDTMGASKGDSKHGKAGGKAGADSGTKEKKGGGAGPDRAGPGASGGGGGQSTAGQVALALFIMGALSLMNGRSDGQEISQQSFLWGLVNQGLVERVEVVNRSRARVFLKPEAYAHGAAAAVQRGGSQFGDFPGVHGDGRDEFAADRPGAESDDGARDLPAKNGAAVPRIRQRGRDGVSGDVSAAAAKDAPYYFNIGSIDTFDQKLQEAQEDMGIDPDDFVPVTYVTEHNVAAELVRHLPTLILLGLGVFMMRNALGSLGGGMGGRGGIFQVGKANPTVVKSGETGAHAMTFADVAGLDEAKTEVMEFVDFLKNPQRYEKLGARIPKGALLAGPPGCGKTLLAKATAGEASVPFFSMSGSDFIEMYVGVGPSRVRDLFAQARSAAPCIVFIDEIDAVGRARGRGGFSGGNDERENTLNALLVEMDGFTSSTGVVVLAGTNRADILDKALLRPGRFDRQVSIDKPDMRGRFDIFLVHLQPLKLKNESVVVAKRLAALTPGFAGADIANICNEAALIAARQDKSAVELVDFEQATDRVIGGLEKKNKVISKKEREIVAHHEAGHAIAGWFLKHSDPLVKVSIIPRGSAALGFAQYLPVDKFLQSREQLNDFMIMALGGRVAEQICFGSITTGAQDDLNRVTRAVYAQITNYGMSDRVGKVNFPRAGEPGSGSQFYKPYSERTAEIIDEEAVRIVDEAYVACEKLLTEKLHLVKALAQRLLEKEVIGEEDLVDVLGDRPYAKPVDYDTFVGRFEDDRKKRTGSGNGPQDPTASDGATTPPIPAEGSEENIGSGSQKRRDAGKEAYQPPGGGIPELA